MNKRIISTMLFAVVLMLAQSVFSAPALINYQGVLTNMSGRAVTGSVTMTFGIWNAEAGGGNIWSETHTGVTLQDGVYNVILGSVNTDTLTPSIFADDVRWLEVTVNGETLTPRQRLTSVAYAHDADMLDGIDSANYLKTSDTSPTALSGALSLPTNGLTIGTNQLAAANGNIGIGITSPVSKLEVAGTIHSSSGGFKFPDGTTQTTAIDSSSFGDSHSLDAADGNPTDVVYVSSLGNVGIGTTGPVKKLEVQGTVRITSDDDPLIVRANISGYGVDIRETDNGNAAIRLMGYATRGRIAINSAGETKVSIDASATSSTYFNAGNIGIGTTTPTQELDIVGDINLENTTSDDTGIIYKNGSTFIHNFSHPTGNTAVPSGKNIFIGVSAGNFTMGSTAVNSTEGSYNTGVGSLVLKGNTTGNLNTAIGLSALQVNTTGYENTALGHNALYLNTTGFNNTALGSYAGRYTAAISSNQTTNRSVYIGFDTKSSASGVTNENVFGYQATGAGSNSVVLGNNSITKTVLKGNVGIGTTTPTQKLHVIGTVKATTFSGSGSGLTGINSLDANDGSPTNAVYVNNSGYVGIGTTTPSGGLHLKGAGYPESFVFLDTDSADQDSGIRLREAGLTKWHIFNMGSSSDGLRIAPGDNFTTGGITVLQTGNVGIGDTTPDYKLDIAGTAYATGAAGSLSDFRHKENISDLAIDALHIVKELRPVTFDWKEPMDNGMKGVQLGFIAQEVEEVLPEAVLTQDNDEQTKGLKYSAFIPVLTKAIQELEKKNNALMTLVCQDHPDASICNN